MTFIFPGHSYIAACLDLYIGTESESDKYFLFVYTIDVRRKVIGVVQRSISLPALAFGSGEGMLPFFCHHGHFLARDKMAAISMEDDAIPAYTCTFHSADAPIDTEDSWCKTPPAVRKGESGTKRCKTCPTLPLRPGSELDVSEKTHDNQPDAGIHIAPIIFMEG